VAGATQGRPGAGRADAATETEAWAILLTVDGLGPASFAALLGEHGSGLAILEAAGRRGAATTFAATIALVEGRGPTAPTVGRAIVELARSPAEPLSLLRSADLAVVTLDDPAYPARLRSIELPPPVLFVRGDVATLSAARTVAVVGTRRASERGRLTSARIAGAIAKAGAVVVSGLAVGIDGAAHAAVVAEGRPTVAVLGSGHRHLFPRAHARLAERIIATGGAVISELWPDAGPAPSTFPRRNRVISGLSSATIVVEAGDRSGALITAGWALDQGRDCYFVPGPIDDPRSAGCLHWLRDLPGVAKIVAGIPELIEDLGLLDQRGAPSIEFPRSSTDVRRPSLEAELVELGPTARAVGRALLTTQGTLDELVVATGHETATVLSAITLLELRGLATTTYGRYRAAGRLASAAVASHPKRRLRPIDRWPGRDPSARTSRLPHRDGPC
jgi:DNA processing protein